ncbi:MAG: hypothetical protein ACRD3F_11770 [Acidobacteriaceae bacterium]
MGVRPRKSDQFFSGGEWLLNLAYLSLGEYPKGVPAQYLIPPAAFALKENIGRFPDVAGFAGLDIATLSGGMLVGDFENNGPAGYCDRR